MAFPQEGHLCGIRLRGPHGPVSGISITATYRPNSEVAEIDTVGITDAGGKVTWTPSAAGIVTLAAQENEGISCELTVSVRFRRIPVPGLVVMLLAGMILFGGNSYSFAKTFGRS
jgi:hypothetical protein